MAVMPIYFAMNLALLKETFRHISANDALDLLCWDFGADSKSVYIDGTKFALSELYDWADEWMFSCAEEIYLSFYGGPSPGRWWKTTLLTMLLDYIIRAEQLGMHHLVHKALTIVK